MPPVFAHLTLTFEQSVHNCAADVTRYGHMGSYRNVPVTQFTSIRSVVNAHRHATGNASPSLCLVCVKSLKRFLISAQRSRWDDPLNPNNQLRSNYNYQTELGISWHYSLRSLQLRTMDHRRLYLAVSPQHVEHVSFIISLHDERF